LNTQPIFFGYLGLKGKTFMFYHVSRCWGPKEGVTLRETKLFAPKGKLIFQVLIFQERAVCFRRVGMYPSVPYVEASIYIILEMLKMLDKSKTYYPKRGFDGDLPWYNP